MKKLLSMIIGSSLILGACGDDEDTVVVGGKDFTEQIILTHMIADLLEENTDLNIDREVDVGSTDVLTQGMQDEDIDLYVEYTGTSYITVLNEEIDPEDPPEAEVIYDAVQEGYNEEFDVSWLEPFDFENRYGLAMREEDTDEIETQTELGDHSEELILGHNADFAEREDGLAPMNEMYEYEWGGTEQMDEGLMYDAVRNEEVDVIAAFTTDGRIPAFDLEILEDDMGYFPPYFAAPIIRNEVLEAHPEIEEQLNELGSLLTEEVMAELNAEVDIDHELEETVANDFLVENGLIEE
ncbi:glycine betaine ABC transporter substrate-binding protein [Salsuginibacillus kocurii]|uniref:glycine betaine ABC transporter substrate-binding protein n=1 Tax=Salsuginibacillus kocurii TaxID=427078 RepID=UPI0003800BC5|nr:glycine betaine ABC transporter substrate-binding protein [Salsuginibacillus kocurii]